MLIEITYNDIYDNLNIDLASVLGVSGQANDTQVCNNFIEEAHDDIINYIKESSYSANRKMKYIITNSVQTYPTIKKAVLEQIKYKLSNGDVANSLGIVQTTSGFHSFDSKERFDRMIAPRAVKILNAARLLYGGKA